MAARYRKRKTLGKVVRNQLLADLAQALSSMQTPVEGARLIQDLLTGPEAEMLAKRLAIADRLVQGALYETIQKELLVSPATIARVSAWLATSGEGFALVRRRKKSVNMRALPPRKRRASLKNLAHWPALLVQDLLQNADANQRQKIEAAFSRLDKKTDLYEELSPLFKSL